jgi:hypothetical protein
MGAMGAMEAMETMEPVETETGPVVIFSSEVPAPQKHMIRPLTGEEDSSAMARVETLRVGTL